MMDHVTDNAHAAGFCDMVRTEGNGLSLIDQF